MKAMILAAGRGERMRPLSDHTPKPLLPVGGKPLIVWQIERLVRGGFAELVINHAHLGQLIEAALGDGRAWGAAIRYSPEAEALEAAGGIAQALPLLGEAPFAVVSGDIYTDFDYARLVPRVAEIAAGWRVAHFVLTVNPPHHPQGDLGIADGLATLAPPRLNYAGIQVLTPRLLRAIEPGSKARLFPWMFEFVRAGQVSAEHHAGRWFNIGTPEQLAALDALLAGPA